jgi:LPXTG-site transpeptidase (sortase) family protein
MMQQQPKQPSSAKMIDPLTAVGALLSLIALTALITYAALILPGKLAAAGGPPDRFRVAATQQAQQLGAASPTSPVTNEDTSQLAPDGTSGATSLAASQTPQPSPSPAGPTPTTNPFGDWPLRGDSDYWLSIPNISLEAPIVAFSPRDVEVDGVTTLRLPVPNSFSVSWDARTAPPGGPGNTVLSGHSNAYGGVFGDLDQLVVGAEIALWSDLGVFSYYVTSIQYVEEKGQPLEVRYQNAANWLGASADTRVTLITCWPQSDSSMRLIIIATR